MAGMIPKNYHTNGGNTWVVGGEMKFAPDAIVTGLNSGDISVTWDSINNKPAVIAAGATEADARDAIGAGTSNFSGAYGDLSGKPTIPNSPDDIGAATAAQGALADSAVQPGDLAPYAKTADLPQGAPVADATDDAITTVNALLASLRAAGLIAT